ncbi:MAG: TIGR02642 family protein, partial [Aeromonas sobria]
GECPKCHGTGRVAPDIALVSRRFGGEVQRSVESMVDEVIYQASDLTKGMERQVWEMRVG